MANKNYFLTGVTELLFLSLLSCRDCYVYDVTKTIEAYSGGLLVISPNTIYTVAYKLESDNYISEYSKQVGRKRTRIYYHLEPKGQEYLAEISEQYTQIGNGVQNFLKTIHELKEGDII